MSTQPTASNALHGQPPRLERHPMLTPPPPRPAECTLNRSAGH